MYATCLAVRTPPVYRSDFSHVDDNSPFSGGTDVGGKCGPAAHGWRLIKVAESEGQEERPGLVPQIPGSGVFPETFSAWRLLMPKGQEGGICPCSWLPCSRSCLSCPMVDHEGGRVPVSLFSCSCSTTRPDRRMGSCMQGVGKEA